MNIIRIINLNAQIWGVVMLMTIFICLHFPKVKHRKIDHYYSQMLLMDSALLTCEIIALLFRGRPGMGSRIVLTISNFLSFFFSNHFAMIFLYYQNEYIVQRIHRGFSAAWFRAMRIMFILSVGLLVVNVFCPFAYHIDEQNLYERLDLYALVHLYYYIIIVIGLGQLIINRKKLKRWEFWSFMTLYAAPVVAEIVVTFIYGIVFSEIAVVSSMISMYVLLEAEYGRNVEYIEQKYMENQIEVMMSQIGPHFVFNALNTIEYLCNVESEDAPKAIAHFTDYLRVNMESISADKLVPLKKELDHVKNYIYIEQLRFPNIEVIFDTKYQDFMIPPLTLQPIVENSIKHGLRRKKDGGVIVIRTEKRSGDYVIMVEDNGIGFDTEALNDQWEVKERDKGYHRSHVGLQNIKNRLEMICGGVCTMESDPGKGTIVTITIPQDYSLQIHRSWRDILKEIREGQFIKFH